MDQSDTNQAAPLVRLDTARVTRGGALLLDALDFRLEAGARWAVLGRNGSGKTTFLRLLRGDLPPDPGGGRMYDLPGQGGPQPTPLGLRQRLALVSGDMQDLYARHEWAINALDVVLTGFSDSLLLYAEPSPEQRKAAQAALDLLGLAHLSGRRMAGLSSGQARGILLARALACRPDALLLDECLEGLDAPARRQFLATLDRAAAAEPALALLFCSHRGLEPGEVGELPACLTQALVLDQGRVVYSGPLDQLPAGLALGSAAAQVRALPGHDARAVALAPGLSGRDFLARITDADVTLDGAEILHHISWTIRPGEHWAVLGENGAGKSTLLGLLAGEFWPSAVNGPPGLVEYGFTRPGETLDEAHRRVGRVSAALDRDYSVDLRVEEAVWSGALGSIGLYAEADAEARARAARLLDFFDLGRLAARRIRSLSRGQLRRVMLARALAGDPALLLLDEPMAGLDPRARTAARALLGRVAQAGVTLVMVTHHGRDLPEQVNRVLVVQAGRIVFCGDRAAHGAAFPEGARGSGRAR